MAEFCLECFRKIDGDMSLTENDVIMDMDLCEGCGEWKPGVIRVKDTPSLFDIFRFLRNLFR